MDRHPAVFDKYELLEEVGCRLTGTDPVFLIREKDGVYEVKGYSVFYYDNTEMQDYLIQREGNRAGGLRPERAVQSRRRRGPLAGRDILITRPEADRAAGR